MAKKVTNKAQILEIRDRLRWVIESHLNTSPSALAKQLCMPNETMNRIFRNEDSPVLPSSYVMLALKHAYPEINLNWIFAEKGDPIVSRSDSDFNDQITKLRNEIDKKDEIIGNLAAVLRNIQSK